MKRILLLTFIFVSAVMQSQNLFTENFDTFPATWIKTNQSQPIGTSNWSQGSGSAFNPGGFNGGATSFTLVNYNSVAAGIAGTISNWLISPVILIKDGDVIKFYSREGGNFNTIPDRLELRLSTGGAVIPSTGAEDLGSFTTLAVSVNPTLVAGIYPVTWTLYTYTVTGIPTQTECNLAFRYYVTNGGPNGANGNVIGLDAVAVDRPLSTDTFFKNNFTVYPNPVSNEININNISNLTINTIEINDTQGRLIKTIKEPINSINSSELKAGVYFLKVTTAQGAGTTKIIKK
jgi:Secretion system C-terminal sorting domain